jgi:hypothetical protein
MDATRWIPRSLRIHVAAALIAALWAGTPARAAETYSPDVVKAAYLFRFAGYVDWPERMPAGTPFIIAVLGAPGVARELRHLLPGHPINGLTPEVREITGAKDLGKPQILYVGEGRAEYLRTAMPAAELASVLVVTDEEGGLNAGSALNFITIDRRVRFEVSLTAADRSGLKISSDLLGVAVRVQGGGRQSRDACSPVGTYDPDDAGCAIWVVQRSLRRGPPRCGSVIGSACANT